MNRFTILYRSTNYTVVKNQLFNIKILVECILHLSLMPQSSKVNDLLFDKKDDLHSILEATLL